MVIHVALIFKVLFLYSLSSQEHWTKVLQILGNSSTWNNDGHPDSSPLTWDEVLSIFRPVSSHNSTKDGNEYSMKSSKYLEFGSNLLKYLLDETIERKIVPRLLQGKKLGQEENARKNNHGWDPKIISWLASVIGNKEISLGVRSG